METLCQFNKHQEDIRRIVADVFGTMLDLPVNPSTAKWSADLDLVTAAVHFAGAWKGALLLECAPDQACRFAARLMPVPAPFSMNDDVRDTLGELSNMVAGNLKSVLEPGVGLSTPSVVEGADYTLRICGDNIVSRLAFSAGAAPFWVALVEMVDDKSRNSAN